MELHAIPKYNYFSLEYNFHFMIIHEQISVWVYMRATTIIRTIHKIGFCEYKSSHLHHVSLISIPIIHISS